MKEWETYMSDFVPEDMLTMTINAKTDLVTIYLSLYILIQAFYEDVPPNVEVYVRGAYFVTSKGEEKPPIDFFIVDPRKKVIYSRRKQTEGIFRINATLEGTYSFVFSNIKVRSIERYCLNDVQYNKDKDLTFALHSLGNDEI